MTAKEYLSRLLRMDRNINIKLQRMEYLKLMSTSVSGRGFEENYNPNQPIEAPYIRALDKAMELEDEVNADIDAYVDFKAAVKQMVYQIPDYDEIAVIEMRYFDCLKWTQISDILGYSVRWVHKLHDKGLESLECIVKENG